VGAKSGTDVPALAASRAPKVATNPTAGDELPARPTNFEQIIDALVSWPYAPSCCQVPVSWRPIQHYGY
jgi:hypothetical protein